MSTVFAFEPALEHVQDGHPEHPDRLQILRPLLKSVHATEIAGRAATQDEIGAVHSRALIESIAEACRQGDAIIDSAPTFVTGASLDLALRAAGAAIECTSHVMRGAAGNAFAIVRPPGHHAEPERAMGFCLFNNVAIAAAWALNNGLSRVAIVDYDAHHGNGTQAAFLNDRRTAFISTHQWGIYPGTGWFDEAPQARGQIVNVPLDAGSGDATYAEVMEEIASPMLHGFKPELLLVSAGFDAHWSDPLTSLGLSSSGFHLISRRLVELAEDLCGGRIVFVLEGGYDPANVAGGALAVLAALTGGPFTATDRLSPHREPDASQNLAALRALHGF